MSEKRIKIDEAATTAEDVRRNNSNWRGEEGVSSPHERNGERGEIYKGEEVSPGGIYQ